MRTTIRDDAGQTPAEAMLARFERAVAKDKAMRRAFKGIMPRRTARRLTPLPSRKEGRS